MRFVVAPSGFKESLDAEAVAAAITAGIRRVVPGAIVDPVPLVDGGEGSARTLAAAGGGELIPLTVTGPVGKPVRAHLAVIGKTAVVEMAAAAGLRLVPADLRQPGATTTYGVGELIKAALDTGCERILVGCGDSGTCDGGAGALQALGARLLDGDGVELGRGGDALAEVKDIDVTGLDRRLADVRITLACNPHNVLCGDQGVARVFGPQKGATPRDVERLAAALDRWAVVLQEKFGRDLATAPGSGASGGLGAGLAGVLGAELLPRFDVLLEHLDLDRRLAAADLVITAEGAIDFQTPRGKIPSEVARRAKRFGKPVIALAGTIGKGARRNYDIGIDAYAGILAAPVPLAEAIDRAAELLTDATERTLRLVLVGAALATDRVPLGAAGVGGPAEQAGVRIS
ncbi:MULTISPECIES: glycerate kinase [unclassified Crossiella]|uniref:glycerate kinase family protein n=1 Tax=unclassified Crossiella TaxID=2620835 RepID=UPI001FFFB99D|nr:MULTISPECIES: glycerate kinase [unclassified Crossiella]MCK2245173.1 glycerate kinase [Crossiella sp. S99.2]MCK2258826.1 glycerate kinase [Crossiella sp. S99.1]